MTKPTPVQARQIRLASEHAAGRIPDDTAPSTVRSLAANGWVRDLDPHGRTRAQAEAAGDTTGEFAPHVTRAGRAVAAGTRPTSTDDILARLASLLTADSYRLTRSRNGRISCARGNWSDDGPKPAKAIAAHMRDRWFGTDVADFGDGRILMTFPDGDWELFSPVLGPEGADPDPDPVFADGVRVTALVYVHGATYERTGTVVNAYLSRPFHHERIPTVTLLLDDDTVHHAHVIDCVPLSGPAPTRRSDASPAGGKWVCKIVVDGGGATHRQTSDHLTESAAREVLAAYARANWSDLVEVDESAPADPDGLSDEETVLLFFGHADRHCEVYFVPSD
ncbi:hypothetical protein [Embleya sp. MST-111070]|uniref:hypothetical protein n=1 Tax=Embleya sp. MST-111070 TaxID=3398231 RepID=UPI003F73C9E1